MTNEIIPAYGFYYCYCVTLWHYFTTDEISLIECWFRKYLGEMGLFIQEALEIQGTYQVLHCTCNESLS